MLAHISHQDPEFYDGHPALRPSGQPAAVKLAPANLLGQAGKEYWMIARRRQLTHIPGLRCIETPVGHIAVVSFCPERIETQVAQGRATIFKGNKPLKMVESGIAFSDSVPEASQGWAFLDAN